jgi:uncharacterized membrane protein YhdT
MASILRPRYPWLHRAAGEVPVITGPEEGAAAGHGRLRASHADRERVIDTLKTAFADGRLDKDELDARVGQTLTARTYAELAMVTVPAQAPPHRPARPPVNRPAVNRQAVKWGLAATGAMIPPAMFVAAGFGAWVYLAFLAMPLLFIELIVVLLFVTITLARQRADRSRTPGGQLPPPQPHDRAAEAGRRGSAGHKPSPRGTRTEQARTDCRSARLVPGAAWAATTQA